jgi:hypothetical protein
MSHEEKKTRHPGAASHVMIHLLIKDSLTNIALGFVKVKLGYCYD